MFINKFWNCTCKYWQYNYYLSGILKVDVTYPKQSLFVVCIVAFSLSIVECILQLDC